MKLLIFGLSVSSAWGNGHATLWRGLIRALAQLGHHVTFYERDTPYYAAHRDYHAVPGGELIIYDDFSAVRQSAALRLAAADVAIVTSYCPDALDDSCCRYGHAHSATRVQQGAAARWQPLP